MKNELSTRLCATTNCQENQLIGISTGAWIRSIFSGRNASECRRCLACGLMQCEASVTQSAVTNKQHAVAVQSATSPAVITMLLLLLLLLLLLWEEGGDEVKTTKGMRAACQRR